MHMYLYIDRCRRFECKRAIKLQSDDDHQSDDFRPNADPFRYSASGDYSFQLEVSELRNCYFHQLPRKFQNFKHLGATREWGNTDNKREHFLGTKRKYKSKYLWAHTHVFRWNSALRWIQVWSRLNGCICRKYALRYALIVYITELTYLKLILKVKL